MVSACSTPGSNAAVRLANGCAVDVERVVRRSGDCRPRAGRHRVPAGAGVGRRLGVHAVAVGDGAVCAAVRRSRADRRVVDVPLDDVLPHPVGGEQQHRRRCVVRPCGHRARRSQPALRRPARRTSPEPPPPPPCDSTADDPSSNHASRSSQGHPLSAFLPLGDDRSSRSAEASLTKLTAGSRGGAIGHAQVTVGGSLASYTDNGADRFRHQHRWPIVRPELLRLVKRGNNKNCQRAVRSRRLIFR